MARKRAPNGSGLQPRLRPDGRWDARFMYGIDPATGKKKYKCIYAHTCTECAKKLREAVARVDEGNYFEPKRMRVSEWLEIWLNEYCGAIKSGTKKTYSDNVKNYLIPCLGGMRLGDLAPHTVQTFINSLSRLSPKTVRNIHGTLNKALSEAVRVRYIASNPAEGCILPKPEPREIHPLEPEEIKAFCAAIQNTPSEDLFFVALNTGLRLGEILGLRWSRVDFENGSIKIDSQLLIKRGTSTERHIAPTKTDSVRSFKPAPSVIECLKRVQTRQNEWKQAAGALWMNSEDLVFTNEIGQEIPHATIEHRYTKILNAVGIRNHRFHDLRHTFTVESLKAGIDPKTVSKMLGHSSVLFTLDVYDHITEATKAEAAEKLENQLKSRRA